MVVSALGGQLGSLVAGSPEIPSAVALDSAGDAVTYSDLASRAAAVAEQLPSAGVIAVLAPRGPALVVGALAAWRAGSAYLPLDPAYPEARIAWMLQDSGAAAVVTTSVSRRSAGDLPAVIVGTGGTLEHVSTGRPGAASRPTQVSLDTAYVVYTSGSTGTPKGVVVGRPGLAQLISWHRRTFGLVPSDRTSLVASPGFDASVWEIWPTLDSGATLVVVPDDVRADPRRLRDWLVDAAITVSFVPTVVAEALVSLPWTPDTSLRWLLTGGDALHVSPPEGLPFQLVNNYGVSEATVVSTSAVVNPGWGVPPIGSAIDGVTLEVVDAHLDPVPDGTEGELLIGGTAVAEGYLGRPDLTAQRFLTGPDGGRRYRSGDLVRRLPGGALDHLGRVDDQLSVRGFRVEPAEVAAAIDLHPAVGASAVGAEGVGAARRLVAWVVPGGPGPVPLDDLRAHLLATLPAGLVPSLLVEVEALPTTDHGKVDHRALLALLPASDDPPDSDDLPDSDGTSRSVVEGIVAELLGVPRVGPHEDFFLLGGHSMLGAELLGRIDDHFGVELSLRTLFDGPTVAQIAAAVDAARTAAAEAPA